MHSDDGSVQDKIKLMVLATVARRHLPLQYIHIHTLTVRQAVDTARLAIRSLRSAVLAVRGSMMREVTNISTQPCPQSYEPDLPAELRDLATLAPHVLGLDFTPR